MAQAEVGERGGCSAKEILGLGHGKAGGCQGGKPRCLLWVGHTCEVRQEAEAVQPARAPPRHPLMCGRGPRGGEAL